MRLPLFVALSATVGCGSEIRFSDLYGEFSAAPATLEFGEVVAGEESRTVELIVTNAGPVALEIRGIDAPDDPSFTFAGDSAYEIEPDDSVVIPVTFAPTALGDFSSALVFDTSDQVNEAPRVPLHGVGRFPYAPDIEIHPPTGVDFGAVALGAGEQLGFFEVANVGDADLDLGSVAQTGAGTFVLDHDFSGTRLAPGDVLAVLVSYTPLQPDGDSGALSIPSNDADEPLVVVPLVANGGGTFDYPVAAIDCPGAVDLAGEVAVVLDGSASYDPLGGGLTYAWSVVRRPVGADDAVAIVPDDAAVGSLAVAAAGVWEVSLVVTSDVGVPSVPAKCVIDAVPVDAIHVELTWSGPTGDMDLHLADGDAAFYAVPGDASWCNPNPDWGVSALADDDPTLLLDDAGGFGPEQIGIPTPADGAYPVRVHFFDDGEDGDTTATVSVFVDGALAWSGSEVLARNEVWDVGQVNWPDRTFGAGTGDPWDAEGARGCE